MDAHPDPLDDEEIDAAFEALRRKRLEWADFGGVADGDFVTTILGGGWAAANMGRRVRQRQGLRARQGR